MPSIPLRGAVYSARWGDPNSFPAARTGRTVRVAPLTVNENECRASDCPDARNAVVHVRALDSCLVTIRGLLAVCALSKRQMLMLTSEYGNALRGQLSHRSSELNSCHPRSARGSVEICWLVNARRCRKPQSLALWMPRMPQQVAWNR